MLSIIRATQAAIENIRTLANETWFETYKDILSPEQADYMFELMYSSDSLREQMVLKGHRFYLAYREQELIGYASIERLEPCLFHVQKLYVHPKSQGSGAGKELLDFVFETCRIESAPEPCTVELNVNRYNKAVTFYQKMGMHIHESGDFDIGMGYQMNDYIMRKDL